MSYEIFAYWDTSEDAPATQAALAAVWRRSWIAHGWTPRLIVTERSRLLGADKLAVTLGCINYGAPAGSHFSVTPAGRAQFDTSQVVSFPLDIDPDVVLAYAPID